MFSEMIQGLLNSGGQAAAAQRYSQLNNYVNNVNKELNPQQAMQSQLPAKGAADSFDSVLQSTANSRFGMLLKNRAAQQVQASMFNPGLSGVNFTKRTSKSEILGMIDELAQKYDVDPKLVQALVKQESGFNPNAKSKAGALGLMQLMPTTAQGLGVTDPMDPKQNLEGGVKYIKSLMNRFNGNVILALAAYNAGPNAVKKYDGVPPYRETQNYVRSVLSNYL